MKLHTLLLRVNIIIFAVLIHTHSFGMMQVHHGEIADVAAGCSRPADVWAITIGPLEQGNGGCGRGALSRALPRGHCLESNPQAGPVGPEPADEPA